VTAVPIAFAFLPAEGTAFSSGYDVPFALPPDGRYFVYVGVKADGSRQLWLRPLSSEFAQPMPGTNGASTPFWSPDSQWVGFFAAHHLNNVRVAGGPPQIVASNVSTYGGATF